MFEEAFEIYKKFSLKTQAIKVLLDQMDDLPRALEYANKVCLLLATVHLAHTSTTCLYNEKLIMGMQRLECSIEADGSRLCLCGLLAHQLF